jgi:23S rRNA (uracil1939-C5)-methyltransferase
MFMEQEVLLKIRDLTVSGEGVGTHEGLTLFVDGALPGELVRAKIILKKPSYAKAELLEVIESSPDRVVPVCPVFGKCGGCQMMQLVYEKQLEIKRKRVFDAFERIGKLTQFTVAPCVPSPKPLHYRNKIQLPVDENLGFGLYAKRSHDIVPIDTCYIQSEAGDKILQEIRPVAGIRHVLIRSNRKGELIVVLVTREKPDAVIKALAKEISEKPGVKGVLHGLNARDDNVLFSDAYTTLFKEDYLEEEILGIKVHISPASFFQVNLEQAENLYQKAFELADLKKGARVLDAYSGIGVFSIYLAKQGADVVGIEVVDSAVKDAKKNAERNGVTIDFRLGTVEKFIGKVGKVDVVFVNPPRKGCEESVLEAIVQKAPQKIIYTSCDPATLARDLHFFAKNGYSKVEAFPFDMFPQTMHVETVVRITKEI